MHTDSDSLLRQGRSLRISPTTLFKMKIFLQLSSILFVLLLQWEWAAGREISITNRCGMDIWVAPQTNPERPELSAGIVKLSPGGGRFVYTIPDAGWGGRFWPKTGCDGSGQNCEVGQSIPPCPAGGCDPPAETKVEFHFPPKGNGENVFYDVSLVDGYTIPAQIVPNRGGGVCKTVNCAVSLDRCPTNENHVGDLRHSKNGRVVQCLSPCKKWNWPTPVGHGKNENIQPGLHLCCPAPVTVEECRKGIVVQTQFVNLVHRECPSAYSYSYDDEFGNYNCPNDVSFEVTFCQ